MLGGVLGDRRAQGREGSVTAGVVEAFAHPFGETADEVERVVGVGAEAHRLVKALEGDVGEAGDAEDGSHAIGVGERERAGGFGGWCREVTADGHRGAELGEPLVVVDALPGEEREKLYEEPKKLVAHGLARASSEMVGQRRRTVYTITAEGRRALAGWVPTPGAGPVVEFEQLIKVFFAEHGTKADLLATLADVRAWSVERLAAGAAVPQAYLDGLGPFPERLPWLVLVGQFLVEFHLMVEHWADWASEIVIEWPDDVAAAQPDREALEMQATIARDHARDS